MGLTCLTNERHQLRILHLTNPRLAIRHEIGESSIITKAPAVSLTHSKPDVLVVILVQFDQFLAVFGWFEERM